MTWSTYTLSHISRIGKIKYTVCITQPPLVMARTPVRCLLSDILLFLFTKETVMVARHTRWKVFFGFSHGFQYQSRVKDVYVAFVYQKKTRELISFLYRVTRFLLSFFRDKICSLSRKYIATP